MRDGIIAAVRTGVAAGVGLLITWLLNLGLEIPDGVAEQLNVALFGLVVAVYNLLVTLLERKVHPYFGVLLGIPKAPAYGDVGTQTPPPAQPVLGDGHVRTDRGELNLLYAGLLVAVVGLVLWLATALDVLGIITIFIGVVLAILSVAGGRNRL